MLRGGGLETVVTVLIEGILLAVAFYVYARQKRRGLCSGSPTPSHIVTMRGEQRPNTAKQQREVKISLMDLNDDVLYEICEALATISVNTNKSRRRTGNDPSPLHAFSMANKRLRSLASPCLLRSIKIGHDWTWYKALKAVNSLEKCTSARAYARTFFMDLYVGPGNQGPPPPELLPMKLARTMHGMRNLKKITLILPAHHTQPFQHAFMAFNVHLPHVKTLILGPHMDWIVSMCPQVEVLSTHDWRWLHSDVDDDFSRRHSFNLINAAGRARKLRHFEMVAWWDKTLLAAVVEQIPCISSLAMTGGRYHDQLALLLPLLKRLECLEMLTLAGIGALGVDLDPEVMMHLEHYHRRPRLDRRREMKASQHAANMVFGECSNIRRVWIGDHICATRTLTPDDRQISLEYTSRNGPTRSSKG